MPYARAISRITEELQKEGFGVLTEIDVKETLKKKLTIDFRKYVIPGACNLPLAYRSLQTERKVGLLLPCNVIVYEDDSGNAVVSAIDPLAAMGMIDNDRPRESAHEARAKLQRVVERV